MKNKFQIILHQFKDGKLREITPNLDEKYPQTIIIDSSGNISWKHLDIPQITDFNPEIDMVKDTTRDLFAVIVEQQKRIDELTDKLNSVIKYLK